MVFNKFFSLVNLISFFWSILSRKRRIQILIILILNFISAIIDIISIASVMPFITAITNPDKLVSHFFYTKFLHNYIFNNDLIFSITLFFIVLNIFSAAIRYISSYLTIRVIFITGSDIGQELYRVTLLQDYEFYTRTNSSELISIIGSKGGTIITNGVTPVINIINNIILYIILLSALLYVNPTVTVFTILIFISIYGLIVFFIKPIIRKEGQIVSEALDVTIKVLQESFGGIREIIFNNSHQQHIAKYNENERTLRNSQSKSGIIMNFPKFIVEPLGMIILAIIAYYLFVTSSKSNPLAELVLITLTFQRLLPIMQQLFSNWSTLVNSLPALEDVIQLISKKPKIEVRDASDRFLWSEKITLKNVYFKYLSRPNYILENVGVEIVKGEVLGFVGKSGSGKSTFIDIISGLIYPESGQMYVDKQIIDSDLLLSQWRNEIAVVSQRIFLLDCSLLENIAFGESLDQINQERVKLALNLADLSNTVSNLPDGLNTKLGERGVQLSGGQLQRIGIARAFYKNASVLILDEITSSLDNETEAEIIKSISKLKSKFTILMISHKISTLDICDKVYEVKNRSIKLINVK